MRERLRVNDVRAIEVVREHENAPTERIGWAFESSDGWVAFTAHPAYEHPLLQTGLSSSREAFDQIRVAEQAMTYVAARDGVTGDSQ